MKGGYFQFIKIKGLPPVDPVERAKQKHKDDCTLRLARIANGAEPGYCKGGRCKNK
jgi:hypothetical protein